VLNSYLSPLPNAERSYSTEKFERTAKALSSSGPRNSWSGSRGKRIFDVAVSAPALLVCLPVLGVIAVAIKCSSPGPVLFRQSRVGKGQRPFTIYKFRTMCVDAANAGSTVTVKGDSRLTGLGKLLRRCKLDELPQLYNVLRGEMSMVGPRPKLAAHEQMKLTCRPGITGAATLVFAREEELLARINIEDIEQYTIRVLNPIKARLDTEYAEKGTLITDLSILLCTVFRLRPRSTSTNLAELSEASPDFAFEN
jgi:lipopolysaccharide/colanic/teichoic acid biosynthesis glycosyltransferase